MHAVWQTNKRCPTSAPSKVYFRPGLPYVDGVEWLVLEDESTGLAMVQEQQRVKDPEARKQLIFAIQRYAAEQQYYVYLSSTVVTASWQPSLKNFAPTT